MKSIIHRLVPSVLFSALMSIVVTAGATLTIAGDLGGDSTSPYFDAINAAPGKADTAGSTPLSPPATLSISDMLPVSTPEMSPGQVTPQSLNLPGMPPVFVVGDDPVSRQWLQQHASDLSRMQATGMVVSVRDEQRLNALRQLAAGVDMVPVSGGDLARRLGLKHYPALITATGLSQ